MNRSSVGDDSKATYKLVDTPSRGIPNIRIFRQNDKTSDVKSSNRNNIPSNSQGPSEAVQDGSNANKKCDSTVTKKEGKKMKVWNEKENANCMKTPENACKQIEDNGYGQKEKVFRQKRYTLARRFESDERKPLKERNAI